MVKFLEDDINWRFGQTMSGFWKEGLSEKRIVKRVFHTCSEDDDDHQRHPTTEDTYRGKNWSFLFVAFHFLPLDFTIIWTICLQVFGVLEKGTRKDVKSVLEEQEVSLGMIDPTSGRWKNITIIVIHRHHHHHHLHFNNWWWPWWRWLGRYCQS